MNWIFASAIIANFVVGNDVWITTSDQSVIVLRHDGRFSYIGTHLSYVDPRTGMTRIETANGGCDMAVAWSKDEIWLQWNQKMIGMDDQGQWSVSQPDCQTFTLWKGVQQ